MSEQVNYLTPDGLIKLKQELAELKLKLQTIADCIDQAKELGDLSENAEYHEAKEDYAFTKGKIMEIENALSHAMVIEKETNSASKIAVGSTIKIKGTNNKEAEYTIVGSNEANPLKGRISNESPLAQAFLGHEKGDKVEVKTPTGLVIYTIKEVK